MLTIYGERLPLRVLEEIRQWKMQEKEHTVVLRQLSGSLEPRYVTSLQQWEHAFDETERLAHELIQEALHDARTLQDPDWRPLLQDGIEQSRAFVAMLLNLANRDTAGMKSGSVRIVAQHAIRITQHYLSIAERVPASAQAAPATARPAERVPRLHRYELTKTFEGTWTMAKIPNANPLSEEQDPSAERELPTLPFPDDALEPCLSRTLVQRHLDIHRGIVTQLNHIERDIATAHAKQSVSGIPALQRRRSLLDAEHRLHALYWHGLSEPDASAPDAALLRQFKRDFGSLDLFAEAVHTLSEQAEGPGWAVLAWSGRLRRTELVLITPSWPIHLRELRLAPLIVVDLAEHAYTPDYANRKHEYLAQCLRLFNWSEIGRRLEAAVADAAR